jgi:hypothetical protein
VSIEFALLLHEGIAVAHDQVTGSNAHAEQLEDLVRTDLHVAETRVSHGQCTAARLSSAAATPSRIPQTRSA